MTTLERLADDAVESLAAYFGAWVDTLRSSNIDWPQRDRFVESLAHIADVRAGDVPHFSRVWLPAMWLAWCRANDEPLEMEDLP